MQANGAAKPAGIDVEFGAFVRKQHPAWAYLKPRVLLTHRHLSLPLASPRRDHSQVVACSPRAEAFAAAPLAAPHRSRGSQLPINRITGLCGRILIGSDACCFGVPLDLDQFKRIKTILWVTKPAMRCCARWLRGCRRVNRDLRRWRDEGSGLPRIAGNLSGRADTAVPVNP